MESKKWYQKFSNWLTIIIIIIIVPVLIINTSIILQARSNEDKVPSVFGYKPFIVLSGSMESKIHVGDLVIVKIIEPETLTTGDVIAFRDAQNTVTTHRIIDIVEKDGNTYFITKGDNNSSQDQNLVEYKDVEGIYKFRIAGVGTIMNSLSQPTTIIIVLLGMTVIFFLGFTVSSKKQRQEEDKEFEEYKRMKALKDEKEKEEFEEFKKMKEEKSKKETGEDAKEAQEVKPVSKKKSTSTSKKTTKKDEEKATTKKTTTKKETKTTTKKTSTKKTAK